MKNTLARAARALVLELPAIGGGALTVGLYWVLRAVFVARAHGEGLVSPAGRVGLGIAGLGAVVLLLRVAVLFVVPAALLYRVVMRTGRNVNTYPPGALPESVAPALDEEQSSGRPARAARKESQP